MNDLVFFIATYSLAYSIPIMGIAAFLSVMERWFPKSWVPWTKQITKLLMVVGVIFAITTIVLILFLAYQNGLKYNE